MKRRKCFWRFYFSWWTWLNSAMFHIGGTLLSSLAFPDDANLRIWFWELVFVCKYMQIRTTVVFFLGNVGCFALTNISGSVYHVHTSALFGHWHCTKQWHVEVQPGICAAWFAALCCRKHLDPFSERCRSQQKCQRRQRLLWKRGLSLWRDWLSQRGGSIWDSRVSWLTLAAWKTRAEVACDREFNGEDGEENDGALHRCKTSSKGTHVSLVPGGEVVNVKQLLSVPLATLFQCWALVIRGSGCLQNWKQPGAAWCSSLGSAFAEHALSLGAGRGRGWRPSVPLTFPYLVRSASVQRFFGVLQKNNDTSTWKWGCLKSWRANLAVEEPKTF